ncbi:GFA family protein [Paracoccus sp. JM45]|uniref:GFA family protein n=1 Tax=Paracoccus sp. JM45 TaxID=2283626 RepID=UPI001C7192C7|nr:GFA family protein [Paracoccus sp. JM45]
MCHCKFCQKATGGAYMIQPVFNVDDFAVTAGVPKVYTHISEGSGQEVRVHFCDTCGTKIFLTFQRFEGAVGIFGGTLDDPNAINITTDNAKHIFLSDGQKDSFIPPHINAFAAHVVQSDGTPVAPLVLDQPERIADLKLGPT